MYSEHLRGDHRGASSNNLGGGVTAARGEQFEECASADDCDGGDG